MTFEIAKGCIDWIFENIPANTDGVEIGFIGGEPLLEFNLIQRIIDYTISKNIKENYIFFASTNGTILTDDMKLWLYEHRNVFVLGLSLDGAPETHNHNRCDSYSDIDLEFFLKTWPFQSVKMTLSDFSLSHLAENIKYLHSLGIYRIDGVNLCEGTFDWSDDKYIKLIVPQLEELSEYYVENDNIPLDQMLDKKIELCDSIHFPRKWCGIGTGTVFFDVDGTKYPCSFVTPMTFSKQELDDISAYDFEDDNAFIDERCINDCYLYPICPNCAGANYLTKKSFKEKDMSKCRLQKLIAIFSADIQAKRLLKHPDLYDEVEKQHLVNAIIQIKENFFDEFSCYLD